MGGAVPGKSQARSSRRGYRENTSHDFQYTDTLLETITSDPGFRNGFYDFNEEVREGLARHAKIWAVMDFSTEFFKQEHWRTLSFTSLEDFQIGFMEAYFDPTDPNDLLCMAWKWQRGDVSRHTGGDLAAALGRIQAKAFVMPIDEDMFFPVRNCKAEQEMILNSELRVVESISGHLGLFNLEPSYIEQVDQHLGDLLDSPA